jgi:phosphoribosylglycinamide formyltransferase-1
MQHIERYQPDLVVLAGFMRILTPEFVQYYQGRLLNIHPSLLPLYKGVRTHERALEDGAKEHGVSVHFVTPELDGGPVIMQARVPVLPSDNPESLAQRVLSQEHIIYPRVVKWFVDGRLRLENNQVYLDNRPLYQPAIHLGY